MEATGRKMDHDIYGFSPLNARPEFTWPGGRKLAIVVVVYIEHWDLIPKADSFFDPRMKGVYGDFSPNYWTWSYRSYGNRIGIHRIVELLDASGLPVTAAFCKAAVDRYPELVDVACSRCWEPVAHGISASRMITSRMSAADEEEHIWSACSAITSAFGTEPQGWLGQDFGATPRTSDLLLKLGFGYTLDWPNDDQPYWHKGPGRLVAVPIHPDWDDVQTLWLRGVPLKTFEAGISETLKRAAGPNGGTSVFTLGVHPWMLGASHRISTLKRILQRLADEDCVWFAKAGDVADHYRATNGV